MDAVLAAWKRAWCWLPFGAALAVLYGPTFLELWQTIWQSDQQGQGPIVLILSIWLLWRGREAIDDRTASQPAVKTGLFVALLGCVFYALGRALDILIFEVGSSILVLAGGILALRGPKQLRSAWFPLFFLVFLVPLPGLLVDALTQPMKLAVSIVVDKVLFALGYPIARSGVILQIGQYQLLVADACAGLHTLFTLEAVGLLYLNVVRHSSALRNVVLAILIVPISFTANVIRVAALTLITYYWGDDAGQGFLHGFAGMVLFLSALMLIIAADSGLRWIDTRVRARRAA